MYSLHIDVCFDHSDDFFAYENFANNHGVTVEYLTNNGPAGGNPVVCLVGSREGITAVVLEFHIQKDLGQEFIDTSLADHLRFMTDYEM